MRFPEGFSSDNVTPQSGQSWISQRVGRPRRFAIVTWTRLAVVGGLATALAVCSREPSQRKQEALESARLVGHALRVRALTYSPDGGKLASGDEDGSVIVWDLAQGTKQVLPGVHGRLADLPLQPRNADPSAHSLAAFGADSVDRLAFSPDGATLAVRHVGGTAVLWDVVSGTMRERFGPVSFSTTRLAFSPDGATLAIGANDSTIRFWGLAQRKVRATLTGDWGSISALRYSRDGRVLAAGFGGGQIRLWEISKSGIRERSGQRAHRAPVPCLAFSPAGRFLASGGDADGIKIWDVETGREVMRLPSENQRVVALEFAGDGRRLIGVGPRGLIQVWNVEDGRQQAALRGHSDLECATISPDGRSVAWGGDDSIVRVWDLNRLVPIAGPESGEPRVRD
jgi:WD40 repeat protein